MQRPLKWDLDEPGQEWSRSFTERLFYQELAGYTEAYQEYLQGACHRTT